MKTWPSVKAHNLFTIIPYKTELLKFTEALSARAYYKNYYIDLITGERHSHDIHRWLETLEFKALNHPFEKRFIHLFYEMGFLFEGLDCDRERTDLLAIDIEYAKITKTTLDESPQKIVLTKLSSPDFHDYEKKFNEGYNELTEGNCYQFNLTGEFKYSFNKNLKAIDFISRLWKDQKNIGAFGSATYIECLDILFLSNSPECLFQYEKNKLVTRPIKGTLKLVSNEKSEIEKKWLELTRDSKSQAELFMIADLLRNDLSRIDQPRAIVTRKKALLLVPGLIHQYSEIKVFLRSHVTFKNILEKIFPGGSITGAPKKRVMMILKKLEERKRGFYCGSTVVFSKNKIEASINIRASVIDFKNLTLNYQAGGGITLLSRAQSEFEEMTYKHDSYIDILTL